jgi:serine/threonine-protein kinase
MGAVWVARLKLDSGFEKLFAVKTLLGHLEDDRTFRGMFHDEARLAAGIAHPNVAQIVDMGCDDERLYLVMEWIDGVSMRELAPPHATHGQTLPIGVLLRVLADACTGLHAIHEHVDRDGKPLEIVHRDVSPQNILVTAQGITKVCDLGVAMARGRISEVTQAGTRKGKVRFMAPEHAAGAQLDRRADVWGVGAVLHTALAGHAPYEAATDVDVVRRILSKAAPPPLESAPAPVRRILERALAVDPRDRHPTTLELADDLESAARELGEFASHRDVGAFVKEAAGKALEARTHAIREALDVRDSLPRIEVAPPTSGLRVKTPPPSMRSSGVVQRPPTGSFRVATEATEFADDDDATVIDLDAIHAEAIANAVGNVTVKLVPPPAPIPSHPWRWGIAAVAVSAISILSVGMTLRMLLRSPTIPEARASAPAPAPTAVRVEAPLPTVELPTTTAATVTTPAAEAPSETAPRAADESEWREQRAREERHRRAAAAKALGEDVAAALDSRH